MNPDELLKVNDKGHSALYLAVKKGCTEIIEPLLAKQPKLIDLVTKRGANILHTAASRGNIRMVKASLKLKPELIDLVDINGETCLHKACSNGHLEVVKILLNAKPKLIDMVDDCRWTVLHEAIAEGRLEIAKFLIKLKPKLIGAVNKTKETALASAIFAQEFDMVRLLLSIKPELIHEKDHNENTVLHLAAKSTNLKLMRYFLEIDYNLINEKNNKGHTVMQLAVDRCNYESNLLLISAGASLDGTNLYQKTQRIVKAHKIAQEVDKILDASTQKVIQLPDYVSEKVFENIFIKRLKFLTIYNYAAHKQPVANNLSQLKLHHISIPQSLYVESSEMLSRLQVGLKDIKALCAILLEHRSLDGVVMLPKYYPACRFINNSSSANLCKFLDPKEQERVVPIVNKWCIDNYFALRGVGKQINWTKKNIYLPPMVIACIIEFSEKVTEKGVIEDLRFK